jgi:acetyl esterase/lipase
MKKIATTRLSALLLLICVGAVALAQQAPASDPHWADEMGDEYAIFSNVVYSVQDHLELKADIYRRRDISTPSPVIVAIHAGGLVEGNKDGFLWLFLPFLQMGYPVVNIDYRLAGDAHAPAAVEDVRCALYWVAQNAHTYGFDPNKIITMGASSGGHLALISAMLRPQDGFDYGCSSAPDFVTGHPGFTVAAAISWSGITDESDSLAGPGAKKWAQEWIGSQPNREQIAESVSPVCRVRPGLPPILLIHGTDDQTVPYAQAVQLHNKLDEDNDPNQLVTILGGHHVTFTEDQWHTAWDTVRDFLKRYNLVPPAETGAK